MLTQLPKIREIQIYQHDLPVKNGPYTMAKAQVWALDSTLVRMIAEDGTEGWGEVCPVGPTYAEAHAAGARAALAEIIPGIIGTQPWPILLHRAMNARLNGHHYAKAALDIAAHDLLGKLLNLRVSDLLGGTLTERIPSYYATGVGEPDEIARLAREKQQEGYPSLQIKVGGRAVEIDIETVRKVWEQVRGSGIKLAVDGNRGWCTRDALRMSRECGDIPFIMEQPCNSIDELRQIRGQISHPIYMDENSLNLSTVIHAVGTGLVDGFGMKVTRIGGLHPMRAFRDICDARTVPHTSDDSWGGDIIAAACVHAAATVRPELNEGAWIAAPYIDHHYDASGGIEIVQGHIQLPQGPGLGITINPEQFGQPVAVFD